MQARLEAEETLFGGVTEYYDRWKAIADREPEWGNENPFQVFVEKNPDGGLRVAFLPELAEVVRMENGFSREVVLKK